jgi:hypothetical protein
MMIEARHPKLPEWKRAMAQYSRTSDYWPKLFAK